MLSMPKFWSLFEIFWIVCLVSPKTYITVVSEHVHCTFALIPSTEEKVASMSYYYDDSSKDDYEQYEEECEWYEEEVPSYNNSSYFTLRDDGNSCEKLYEEYPLMFSS